MLGRVDFDLTATQIGEFMVFRDYLNYFSFQQLLYDMEQDGLVTTRQDNHQTYYHVEDSGRAALEYFAGSLQPDIRAEIDEYVRSRQWEMSQTASTRTDYTLNANGEYAVRLQEIENGLPLIDLTVTVPDEKTAQAVCGRWKERSSDIYGYIMGQLLQ